MARRAFTIIYCAQYGRYLQQGIEEHNARQRAYGEVRGYLGNDSMSAVRQLSALTGKNGHNGQEYGQPSQVKARVRAYLDASRDLEALSVN